MQSIRFSSLSVSSELITLFRAHTIFSFVHVLLPFPLIQCFEFDCVCVCFDSRWLDFPFKKKELPLSICISWTNMSYERAYQSGLLERMHRGKEYTSLYIEWIQFHFIFSIRFICPREINVCMWIFAQKLNACACACICTQAANIRFVYIRCDNGMQKGNFHANGDVVAIIQCKSA